LKRKVKKNVAKAIVHIKATFNNTIITICDLQGNTLAWGSSGTVGFKGTKKSTPYAAQIASLAVAKKAKEMAKQKSGAIVNIASIAMGQVGVGFQGLTHYCASKGGIVAMAEAMALELAPLGIRVNCIAPGAIDTPMAASVKTDSKTLEAQLAVIPLHRMGKPEEIANAVLFLASDESSYMTGSVVVVDGGWLAG
jgi:NAD(P)-dependent dehydrogenase (short-subunit alcohol dehydrogenase family)